MEIRKTSLQVAYKIEEKPDGGFIARSDNAKVEPIEAATKVELFQKMRVKTAELVGKEVPLESILKSTEFASPVAHVGRNISMNVFSQRRFPQTDAKWMSNRDARVLSEGTSRWGLWKLGFFVLLVLLIGWAYLR